MNFVGQVERAAIAEAKRIWDGLSAEGKVEIAKSVSWAERHFWWVVPSAFGIGIVIGAILF